MNWFTNLFSRRHYDDISEEIREHLDEKVEELVASGMSRPEAVAAARRQFGNVTLIEQRTREVWQWSWLANISTDIRYAVRMLLKSPGFTAVAILTLALGIGATTAIFTVVYATLLAPLPFPHPERLVMVWSEFQGQRMAVTSGDFTDWKRENTAFEDLNAWTTNDYNIATPEMREMVDGISATPGYYSMLGEPLFLGRNFRPDEAAPGKDHVVILTYRLWQRLGADPKIVGTTKQINGETYIVIGVTPPTSILASGNLGRWVEELILPLVFTPDHLNHDDRYLLVAGRLKSGVSIKQAQAEMDSLAAQEAKNYPTTDQGHGVLIEPYKNDFLPSDRQSTLRLLLGAVGFLLLIACLNVANLLLAKGITRQREIAIRSSLGAQRAAIFAQFLTESLVIAIMGGLLGIVVGYVVLRGLIAVTPPHTLPPESVLRLNIPILLAMLAAATLSGVLFGCAPAWYAARLDPSEFIKEGGRSGIGAGRHRLRRLLVISEFALALPLLAGAGLTIRSFRNLTHVDVGVRTDHILGFYLEPLSLLHQTDQDHISAYYRRALASISAVPGVTHVAALSYFPFEAFHDDVPFAIAGQPAVVDASLRPQADREMITPDYFQTFGIRIVKGRNFTDADNSSGPRVAIVNEAFANKFLQGLDPLEQRVFMEQIIPESSNRGPTVDWQIVGVAHSIKSRGFRDDYPEIDMPFWQSAYPISFMAIRTEENPASMLKAVSGAISSADPNAGFNDPVTMDQVHDEALGNERFPVILFASFAVLALLLAAIGIHGVTAFSVAQRSHEIALRMALGASRNRVVAMVLKEGVILASVGLAIGLGGAYFVGRAMQSTLYGVGTIDFLTISAVGLVLLIAALLACYLPAQKATRADPMVALRHE